VPEEEVMGVRDVTALLRERARALALPEAGAEDEQREALATFSIAGQAIGVALERVSRAAELRQATPVPGAAAWLLGVISVEGQILSLVDVATLLDVGRRERGAITGALVVHDGARLLALAAEQLLGIRDVPAASITRFVGEAGPLPAMVAAEGSEHGWGSERSERGTGASTGGAASEASGGPTRAQRPRGGARGDLYVLDVPKLMADRRLGPGGPATGE
jgi:chemotaxis signal transduction protein